MFDTCSTANTTSGPIGAPSPKNSAAAERTHFIALLDGLILLLAAVNFAGLLLLIYIISLR